MMRLEGVFSVEVYRGVQIWGQCSYDECQYWSDLETYTYDTIPEVRVRIDIILGGVTYLSSLEVQIVNPRYGVVYVQAPNAVIVSGLYMFAAADTIMIELQPSGDYVMGNVYVDGVQKAVPPEGGQLTMTMNVNHVVLINFATYTPEIPSDEFIETYRGYDIWREYYEINNVIYSRYRVYPLGGHDQVSYIYSTSSIVLARSYIDALIPTPDIPDDVFIETYQGYDIWFDYYEINNVLYSRYGVYEHGVHILANRLYSSTSLDRCYNYINELEKPEIPVEWRGAETLESGVYRWSLKFDIVPIPFLDNWIVDMVAGRQDDEANLNQVMRDGGYVGTATILEKTVSKHTNWLGNVDSFTITYKVVFTTGLSLAPGQRSLAIPLVALYPFVYILGTIILAIITYLAIKLITSTLTKIMGPNEYTPSTPGDCAEGWVYDEAKGVCVKKEKDITKLILLVVGGAVVTAILLRGK